LNSSRSSISQANDLDKIVDIITNFKSAGLSNKPAIAEFFDFDERQGDYYANAGYYLGLLNVFLIQQNSN